MTLRPVVLYSQEPATLRKASKPVDALGPSEMQLIRDLKDTLLHRTDGIGLAAPQIASHRRVIAVWLGSRDGSRSDSPQIMVNPEILQESEPLRDYDGCLSFPDLYGETVRPHLLTVKGLDEAGKPFRRRLVGFDAVLVHHEIDHLEGVLFIDRASSLEDLYVLELDQAHRPVRRNLSVLEALRMGIEIGRHATSLNSRHVLPNRVKVPRSVVQRLPGNS
ncbi:MAG: peptide deformylase [Anaerolineales bacterium]